MPNVAGEIRKAVVAVLKADGNITGLVGQKVYSRPPQDVTFPYITFGPTQRDYWSTDTFEGSETFIQVDVYSRAPSDTETLEIQAAVNDALHDQALTLDTQNHVMTRLDFETAREDQDTKTTRGIQRFRVITHP